MKIQFEPKDFLRQFKIAASVAPVRDVKPILGNVKIVADKHNGVVLMATDIDIGIRIRVEADVSKNGEALLPPKQFRQILESAKDERLVLESTKNGILVTGAYDGNEQWGLDTQSPDEFPDVADFTETAYHEIPVAVLSETIRRTMFATDKEHDRFALGGVHFESDIGYGAGSLCAVATDGRRLAIQDTSGICVGDHSFGWTMSDGESERRSFPIVPVNVLKLLTKVMKDKSVHETDEIKMAFTGEEQTTHVLFQCNGVTIFSRLLDGRFPMWRSIVPETVGRLHAQIRCETLLTAVNQMVTSDREPGVMFSFRRGSLTLESRAKESGLSKVAIPIAFDDTVDLIFDVSFIRDYLRSLDADTAIDIYMTLDNDPVLFETDGGDYRYIVMPMSCEKTASAEPEADTGIEVVGQVSTEEESMRNTNEASVPDNELETKVLQLLMENDQLQARAEQYKVLLDRAMRVIEQMQCDQRVCV